MTRTWSTGTVYVDGVNIGSLTLEGCPSLDRDCDLPGWRIVRDRRAAAALDVNELWANMEGRGRR